MQCPICKTTALQLAERQQVEIDYCPDCRGVWLDRGELDKIIERSAEPVQPTRQHSSQERYYEDHEARSSNNRHHGKYSKKKRSSFLGELFDF